MTTADALTLNSRLPDVVLEARRRIQAGRERLRQQHSAGLPGIQVCAALTELVDEVLLDLFRAALDAESIAETRFNELAALVPHGGYGRRDVAPYSDIDLMLLVGPQAEQELTPFIRRFTQYIYDLGYQLGYATRTVNEACQQILVDPKTLTSLAESRFLAGNDELFAAFQSRFRWQVRRHRKGLLQKVTQERRDERSKFGDTNYLLEPDVKKSRGGLRDIQLVRWIGFLVCGEVEPDNLVLTGALTREEAAHLQRAREYLLQKRNELHFQAGRAQDVLNKPEQLRLAELYGFKGDEGVLPVEQFMRQYFEYTSEVRYIASNIAASPQPRQGLLSFLAPLITYRYESIYRVGIRQISVARRYLPRVASDPAEVLRFMELASLFDRRIEHRTWSTIRQAMVSQQALSVTDEASKRFMALLATPKRLGEQLRRLHELRVLEQLIPPMAHARCLLQFNDYHKYTVDEHSLRAVECAVGFMDRQDMLGATYRDIKRKDLLHLALLLHDLGKGFKEDHSELGRKLAEEVGYRLGLPEPDIDILRLLVHKHLVMSHLAQWRDTSDPKVTVQFAVEVGSPQVLRLLYVLTCADLAAVGPGVLTDWKLRLLTDVYLQTLPHISADAPPDPRNREVAACREAIRRKIAGTQDSTWWESVLASLPRTYLVDGSPEKLAEQLERVRQLPHNRAIAWGEYLPNQKAVQYTVGTYEQIVPGIFHRLTGALSGKGLSILSAEIHTLAGSLVLDRFYVQDGHFADEPPAYRLAEVCEALVQAIEKPTNRPTTAQYWQGSGAATSRTLSQMPTQVRIDNTTSNRHTIVEVFTFDRTGLLFTITRKLFELELSVHVAKIGTHLDQVVDVFYVTDQHGRKIENPEAVRRIRHEMLAAIEPDDQAAKPSST